MEGSRAEHRNSVKRGIFTIHKKLVLKSLGDLVQQDAEKLEEVLSGWLEL